MENGASIEIAGLKVGTDGVGFNPNNMLIIGAHVGDVGARGGVDFSNGLSVGGQAQAFNAEAGGDIGYSQDGGFHAGVEAGVYQTFIGGGANLQEFFRSAKAKGGIADDVINELFDQIRPLLSSVAGLLNGIDLTLFRIREDSSITVGAAVGLSARIRVGVKDSDGYNMVGGGGDLIGSGGELYAGLDDCGSVKVMVEATIVGAKFSLLLYFVEPNERLL